MKKLILALVVVSFYFVPFTQLSAQPASQGAVTQEVSEHPRIAAAIASLQDAIDYMQTAPHNFGGHKAAAIAQCQKAINQLHKAMTYRAKKDRKY